MPVVLHIGLPKTGSSYLQDWLKLNHQVLLRGGVHVVSSAAARRLGVEVMADPMEAARQDVRLIRDDRTLSDALGEIQSAGRRKAVIASEYLSLCQPDGLAEILAAARLEVSDVVCYLRRQDHICASGYAQAVKANGCGERVGTVEYTERLNWNLLYESWQAAFPGAMVHIHNYDNCCADVSLLRSYKEGLGVSDLATNDPVEYINLSLSAEMTEIARMLNERQKPFDPEILLKIQIGRSFVPFGFSKNTTAQFEELFIESNRKLAERFPLEFSDFAQPDWRSKGEDMTDLISPEWMADILAGSIYLEVASVSMRRTFRHRVWSQADRLLGKLQRKQIAN